MADVYIGQIMMTGFGFAQRYFAQCNGQLMPVNQNQALFALLGVVYGGDGRATFGLPNLASRTPAGGGFPSSDAAWQPPLYPLGLPSGVEAVSLNTTEIPAHTHLVTVTSAAGNDFYPSATNTLATITPAGNNLYGPLTNPVALAPQALAPAGSSAPHSNLQPYQSINFNIAVSGVYPTRG